VGIEAAAVAVDDARAVEVEVVIGGRTAAADTDDIAVVAARGVVIDCAVNRRRSGGNDLRQAWA
jgi:hypothetical protein